MSYYFTILSPTDAPLFSISFGTSKGGADGIARFRFPDTAQYMNQFIVHSSLDIVEEAQWTNGAMYLKHIDTYPPAAAYVSAFLTPSGARFLLLHQPPQVPSSTSAVTPGSPATASMSLASSFSSSSLGGGGSGSIASLGGSTIGTAAATRGSSSSIAANPTAPQTEEAVRQFMNEVYENYVKTAMSPFYRLGMEIGSPVFRSKVAAAGKKWL